MKTIQVPSIMHITHFFIHQLSKIVALQPLLYQYNTQSKVPIQIEPTMHHHATTKSKPRCTLDAAWRFQTAGRWCTKGSCAEHHFLHLRKCPSPNYATHSCNRMKIQSIMRLTLIHTQLSPLDYVHTIFIPTLAPSIILIMKTGIKWLSHKPSNMKKQGNNEIQLPLPLFPLLRPCSR